MGYLKFDQEIFESYSIRLKEKGFNFSPKDVSTIIDLTEDEILYTPHQTRRKCFNAASR